MSSMTFSIACFSTDEENNIPPSSYTIMKNFINSHIVVGLISSYTTYFTCFAVGQRFTGHPIAGAILSYMVLSFIMQIISTLAITAFSFTDFYDKLELDDSSIMYSNVPSLYLGFLIAFSSFLTIILFLISNHMFKNKLNI